MLIIFLSLPEIINFFRKTKRKYLLLFFLLLLSFLVGLSNSKNPPAGLLGVLRFVEIASLSLCVYLRMPELNSKKVFLLIFIALSFESLLSVLQYLNQGSLGGAMYFLGERAFNGQTPGIANASVGGQLILRPYATFPHPNVLSGFLIFYMLLLIYFSEKNFNSKVFLYGGLILGSLALLISLSRAAIFLWAVYSIIFFSFAIYKKYKKARFFSKTKIVVGVFIFLALLGIIFLSTPIAGRFFTTSLSDESVVQREFFIKQAEIMFIKNPIFGVGLNNFYNNLSVGYYKASLIQPVHNIFLLTLSQTGLIGLSALAFLFYEIIHALKKKLFKEVKYLWLVFLAIIFLGMFDHYFFTLQQGQLLFSLFLGITFSQKRV